MRRLLGLALLLSICGPALAQGDAATTAAPAPPRDGGWTPQGCGDEPPRPSLDLGDREKYNRSAELVNEYEARAKAWDTCVMKEANTNMNAVSAAAKTRMGAISQEATSIQGRVYAGFGDYTAQFKAAQDKFEHEK